jgi:AraC-like DNA-binding protein
MARPWTGLLALDPGWALFVGAAGDNALHGHHAIQLCLSAGDALAVETPGGRRVSSQGVAIDRGAPHRVELPAGSGALLYVEPASVDGRRLRAWLGGEALRCAATARLGEALGLLGGIARRPATWDEARRLRDAIVSAFAAPCGSGEAGRDPRVARVVERIEAQVGRRRICAEELASQVGLSPSRLAALFRRETGLPVRPFVLWTRLRRAVELASRGASLTEAAHAAGFADSAHLARTFRRMFGTTPSSALGRLHVLAGPP